MENQHKVVKIFTDNLFPSSVYKKDQI